MTKEEAISKIRGYLTGYLPSEDYEEVEEIIKALEQEPILNKIRAEIEMEKLEDSPNFCIKANNNAVDRILGIIDKYKPESEE